MSNEGGRPSRSSPYPDSIQPGKVESKDLPSATHGNVTLFKIRAHWLVDLFPDELVVQRKTISIVRNEFLVSFVETIPVKDIGRVVYVNTPIFAGLRIIGKNTAHELSIKGLNKNKAAEAKDIIEGLMLEEAGAVEIPHWIETEHKREMLADAGRDTDDAHRMHGRPSGHED